MIKKKSVGFIVFRRKGRAREYLVLHYGAGHWDFVKGGAEEGEDELATATRELREETGIKQIRVESGFKEKIKYFYREGKELVFKEVVFLLGEAKTARVKLSFEHTEFKWLPFEEARSQLSFKTARDVLAKANDFLKKRAPNANSFDA